MKLLKAILLVLMIIGNIKLAIMEDSIYGQLAGLWAIQFAMFNSEVILWGKHREIRENVVN